MGILLVSCSGLSDWLSTLAQGDGRWGEHILCAAVPRVVVRRASPPVSCPSARRGHVRCHHRGRCRPPPSRRSYFFLVAVAVGHDEGGGRRARATTRGATTTRAGGIRRARGGGAPRRRRARGRRRGEATTRGTVSNMNALPTRQRQPSLLTFFESALPRGCRTGRSDRLFSTFIFYLGEYKVLFYFASCPI